MNIKKLMKSLLCGSLILVNTGCEVTHGANMQRINNNNIDVTHPRAELVIASDKLLNNLVMTNVRFGNVGNFQRTEIGMQNISARNLNLEYKIDWQDNQGFSVNSHSIWKRFSLSPKQIKNVQSVGKVPEAYQVLVTVRLPNDMSIDSYNQKKK